MTKNDEIAINILKKSEIKYTIEQNNDIFKMLIQCLEYKDKEIIKIKEALQSVLNEFSKFNIG